jgi:hypothetical protein
MRFYDRFADRKTHSHAAFFGSEESIKDLLEIRNSDALISNLSQNNAILLSRGDSQCLRSISDSPHRVHRIQDQIHQNLLKLEAIANDPGEVSWQLNLNRYFFTLSSSTYEGDHLMHDRPQVN